MVGHGGLVRDIAVSADGTTVLSASFDYTLRRWRFDDQTALDVLSGHAGPVNAVAFLSGSGAVSAGGDGRLIVWRLGTGEAKPARILDAHRGQAAAIAVSGDGATLLSGGWDGTLALWDANTGAERRRIAVGAPVIAAAFGVGDAQVISGTRDGELKIYRRRDGILTATIPAHDLGLTAMAVSPDKSQLATIGLDNMVRVWTLDPFAERFAFLADPVTKPLSLAFSPDDTSVVVGFLNGDVRQLDTGRGRTLAHIREEAGPVWAVALSADGRFLLSASSDERIKVWHLESGARIGETIADDPRPTPWLTSDHPGAVVYRKCAVCHATTAKERQRSGPHFTDLFGRRAGSVAGYAYTPALANSKIVWTPETIADLFRRGPDTVFPGTKMPVQTIPDEAALAALVDFMAGMLGQTTVPAE